MHDLVRDLRMARRALGRSPGFTIAAVLTLALGVGASTAIFTVVDAALLRALPFRSPRQLAFVSGAANAEREIRAASFLEVRDWMAQTRAFDALSLYSRTGGVAAAWSEEAEQVPTEIVSANYFDLLGVRPERGRTFLRSEDEVLDRDAVAVISHDLWQSRFGGDSQVVGRELVLNRRRFQVVGVMPAGFHGVAFDAQLWLPAAMATTVRSPSALADRGSRSLSAVGRLRANADLATAQADMDRVARQLQAEYPATNRDRWAVVQPLREATLGGSEPLLRAVFGGALLLLLVACANVTALQLVRATGREREVAIYRALGAGSGRVLRHQLAEAALLAVLGGAVGALAARGLLALLLAALPANVLPGYVHPTVDTRALFFALAATLVAAGLGALPALRGVRADLSGKLRRGAPSAAGGLGELARPRPQQLLVIAEVALSLVLLISAGLLARTLVRLTQVAPGFAPDRQLAFSFKLPTGNYAPEQRQPTAARLADAFAALPGVESVAMGSDLPLRGSDSAGYLFLADGSTPDGVRFYRHRVMPGYFAALGVPILRGRALGTEDREGGPAVAVISRSMARRFWGEERAIGQRFRVDDTERPPVVVVGIAGDVRFRDLTTDLGAKASEPDVYLPFAQQSDDDMAVALRVVGDPAAVAPLARAAVAKVDPNLAIYEVATLTDVLASQTALQRLGAALLAAFAAAALLLAAVGVYGVIAYVVGKSRREIALRMALGGARRTIVALVVRQGMTLVVLGVVAGLLAAGLLSRALAGLLFGVGATDPVTFVAVPLLLLLIALAASLVPAWRAAALEPQAVLRGD